MLLSRDGEYYHIPDNVAGLDGWQALALYDMKDKLDNLLKFVDIESLKTQEHHIDNVLGKYKGESFMIVNEEELQLMEELEQFQE